MAGMPRFRESTASSLFCTRESIRCIDGLAAHDRQQRSRSADLLDGDGHDVLIENDEVGELAVLDRSAPRVVEAEPGTAHGIQAQGLFAAGRFVRAARRKPADRLAVEHPLQRYER